MAVELRVGGLLELRLLRARHAARAAHERRAGLFALGAPDDAVAAGERQTRSEIPAPDPPQQDLRGRSPSPSSSRLVSYTLMLAYFLSGFYTFSEEHPLVLGITNVVFLVAGCLYWWPVVGLDPSRWKLSFPGEARLPGHRDTGDDLPRARAREREVLDRPGDPHRCRHPRRGRGTLGAERAVHPGCDGCRAGSAHALRGTCGGALRPQDGARGGEPRTRGRTRRRRERLRASA